MTPSVRVFLAESEGDLRRSFEILVELRPHLTLEIFLAQVRRQFSQGYQLACLEADGQVRAVAGFRPAECLAWGRYIHVDDLVTRTVDQGTGYGSRLLDWLLEKARAEGFAEFHLDSGVQRFGAHRFYLHKGMDITSHHFALKLTPSR